MLVSIAGEFCKEAAQDSFFTDFFSVLAHQLFHGMGQASVLIYEQLNEDVAGVATAARLAGLGDLFNPGEIVGFYRGADDAFLDLETLANNFILLHNRGLHDPTRPVEINW